MPALHLSIFILVGFAGFVLAQAVAPLPKTMSGRWTTVMPDGANFSDKLSLVLDVPVGVGPLTGRMTLRGTGCGALDEPLAGTWDGNELRFESQVRPNENTISIDRDCGTGHIKFDLFRKPGKSLFEGESRRDGALVASQITLEPPVEIGTLLLAPETWTLLFGLFYIAFHLISIGLSLQLRQLIKPHAPAFSKIFAARTGRWPPVQSVQFKYALPWVPPPAELGNYSSSVRNVFRAARIVSTIAILFLMACAISFYLGGGNPR